MANFPSSVYQLNTRTDLVDTVKANDINTLQAEINALETTLGAGSGAGTSLLYSTWTGTFSQSSSPWSTLNSRISNIEVGVVDTRTTASSLKDTLVGSGNATSTLLTSTWAGTFTQSSSWSSLNARLINLERGTASNTTAIASLSSGGGGSYQPLSTDLTAISNLTAPLGLLKKNASGAWSIDTNSYVTSTSLASSLANYVTSASLATYVTSTSLASSLANYVTSASLGSSLANYQPLDTDLTAIAALNGTSGFLKTNGSGTWTVDTNTYVKVSDLIDPLLLAGM